MAVDSYRDWCRLRLAVESTGVLTTGVFSLTLRSKLTLLYLLVFGIILGGLSIILITVREVYIAEDFDQRLIDRARSMVEAIMIADEGSNAATKPGSVRPRQIPFRFPGYYFQLRLADGTTVERSDNLLDHSLPWQAERYSSLRPGEVMLDTIGGPLAETLLGGNTVLRLLTLYHEPADMSPFFLQIGVSRASIDMAISELRRLFLMVIPAGLFMAGVASYFLARRSLAPIGRIAREARELTAAHLDRRLPSLPGRDEVAEMVTTINQMLDRLEASFKAQERFIANAAHELRTPTAVVLGQAQVLSQQPRSLEEYQQFLISVQEEMRRIGQLVTSLLTLARADAGLPPGPATAVAIPEVVIDAVQRCQSQAQERDVRLVPLLSLPSGDESDPMVTGDPELLRSMVLNLIQNAIRHSPSREAVEIEIGRRERDIIIAVRDRGCGIPEKYMGLIFESFFRVPARDEKASLQGTGLGLAIARGVARMHGGEISVANRSGSGSEFIVRLPLIDNQANEISIT